MNNGNLPEQKESANAGCVRRLVSCVPSISELMDDINAMRSTVLYLENRILRKEIAIQEILSGKECREDQSCTPPISAPPVTREPESPKGPSVKAMVESILPELNGSVFWYRDIKEKCLAKYPAHEDKIRRGIHPACHELLKHGILEKCPGGLQRKAANS